MSKFESYRTFRAVKSLFILSVLAFLYIPICLVAKLKYYLLC